MFETRDLGSFPDQACIFKRDAGSDQKDRIVDYVKRCTEALRQLGVKEGDHGGSRVKSPQAENMVCLDGRKEEEIVPAIEELKAEGYDVEGPVGLIRYSTRRRKENTTAYCPCIMTRDISPLKRWISIVLLP